MKKCIALIILTLMLSSEAWAYKIVETTFNTPEDNGDSFVGVLYQSDYDLMQNVLKSKDGKAMADLLVSSRIRFFKKGIEVELVETPSCSLFVGIRSVGSTEVYWIRQEFINFKNPCY